MARQLQQLPGHNSGTNILLKEPNTTLNRTTRPLCTSSPARWRGNATSNAYCKVTLTALPLAMCPVAATFPLLQHKMSLIAAHGAGFGESVEDCAA
jgi:hypothetical protein